MSNRTRTVNDIGLGLEGAANEKLKDLRVYVQSGNVYVEVDARDHGDVEVSVLQYLSPVEAMAFAKAFEHCAIQALKESA